MVTPDAFGIATLNRHVLLPYQIRGSHWKLESIAKNQVFAKPHVQGRR